MVTRTVTWKTKRVKLNNISPRVDPLVIKRFHNTASKRRYFRTERGRRARREAMATYRLKPWVRVYNSLLRLKTGITVTQLKSWWDRDGAANLVKPMFDPNGKRWIESN